MKHNHWIGQTLNGRYKIEELLGQGGMSAVYKAIDPNLRRTVAIKIVHPHLSDDPSFIKRFEEEAAAIASLRHPNIVQVFDFNTDEDVNYMVMEFVGGETLQARLKRLNENQRKMPVEEAIKITLNVCDGLSYAHKRGMIHRDVKPANIMLDVNNQAILMDFGIVKIVGSASHTLTGAVVGTANYMAPEIIRSETADQRSDIYSLGITLYEMLSGKPPFDADSAMTIMMMHLNDPVPDLEIVRDDLPAGLVKILNKALAKDRNERYETADEFADDLRKLMQLLPTQEIKKPVEQLVPDEQKELHTSTQIFQADEGKDPHATFVEEVQKTQIADAPATLVEETDKTQIAEAPATRIEKPVQKQQAERPQKKGINKGLLSIVIGGLLVVAIVVIGFSTSWFGLAGNTIPVVQSSPTIDQVSVRQTTIAQNAQSTESALALKNQQDEQNFAKTEQEQAANQEKFLACQLTDIGSIEDSSFLQAAYQGLTQAEKELNVGIEVLESNQDEYEMHLNQFVEMQCDLIISVGFMLGDITVGFAETHPDIKFSIIDYQVEADLPNLNTQVYQIDQASFLAGYLAASISETKKVATYGGLQIKPVEIFMDGFARGVQFYNERKAQNVQVVGWDFNTHSGMFVESFDDQDIGAELANELINQNVDVIFPVAGAVGLGSAMVAMERGGVQIIGVDSDWAVTYPEVEPVILTSTIKSLNNTVFNLVQNTMEGRFNAQFIGNLENGGVELAPFHNFEDQISDDLRAELQEIRELIISGQIEFFPDYQY